MEKIRIGRLLVIFIILSLLTLYTLLLRGRDDVEVPMPDFSLIPAETGGFVSDDHYIGIESLRVLGADTTIVRSYSTGAGFTIELFIGYFASQQKNSQIHSPKHCYPGAGWDIIKEDRMRIEGPGPVKRLLITDGESHRMVIYWFSMNGESIPDEFSLKYHQMKNTLFSRPQAAAFIRFSTGIRPGGDPDAADAMLEFIDRVSPDIMSALRARSTKE